MLRVFEVQEKRGVLGEVRLKLRNPDAGPVLQPAVLEVRFDPVKAAITHERMIGSVTGESHEPKGLNCQSIGPNAFGPCLGPISAERASLGLLAVPCRQHEADVL